MKIIEVHLPDDLAVKVFNLTGNAEKLIIDLLRSKINDVDKPLTLADEYYLANIENAPIKADFVHIDLEGWGNEY